MKKGIIAILVIALAVVSCGGPKKQTLNVLAYIDATQAGYAEEQAIWAKFAADNPDIEVVKEELFNEPFHQKVEAYVASGKLPDVMFMWPSGRSTTLHEKKLLKDLKPLLGDEFLSEFVPVATDPANQFSGYMAMLPQAVTYTSVMYANKKLLDSLGLAIPTTYEELKALTPKLKAKGKKNILMANKDTWVMQSCLYSTIVGRMMGNEAVDKLVKGDAKFTDPDFVSTLAFVKQMYTDGVIDKSTLEIGYGEVPALFASGASAFLIDGDWRQGAFLTDKASGKALISPEAQKNDFVMIQFPAIDGEVTPKSISAICGTGYGIANTVKAKSAKEKAAVKLINYLYSPEVLKTRLETGAFIPSRKGISSDALEPFTLMMADYYATVEKSTYVLDGVLDAKVCEPINVGLQEIGLGTKTPEQVAADTQAAYDTWKASK